jgi:DNA-binding winged helix-turn-helix (wHTH) protein
MLYVFGDYELDSQRYELRCAGRLLKIEPQVFNVLAYLIQHRDRTVTRQELLEQLWPEQYISDAVVSYCIMAARKAVGDSGRAQQIIKTVHGRGFRFVAPLQERVDQAPRDEVLTVPETPGPAALQQHHQGLADTASCAATSPIPGSAPGGAHHLITLLCATIAHATPLTEQLSFDELQRLRQGFFAAAQHLAEEYQGTLRFFGADGILILFDAAKVCEPPAGRAVLAATELCRRLQTLSAGRRNPQVAVSAIRIGLHTGAVPGDTLSGDPQLHATALGETIHLAVWLQYLAEPGTLLISEATMRLLQAEVPYATRREVHVPGQPQPVKTYVIRASGG